MLKLGKIIDRWLFEEYRTDPESLAFFRIIYASYVLAVELPNGLWRLPRSAFSPPVSLAALFTDYPAPAVMVTLNLCAILCACCLLIGLFTELASFGLFVATVFVESFCFADGKIDEGLLVFISPLLAYSGWGSCFSVDQYRRPELARKSTAAQPSLTAILALVVGFALFTAGSAKLHGGWLHPKALGTRYHLFWDYYVFGRQMPLATWALQKLPAWAWKCGDWMTMLWELSFTLTVFRRSWCRVACAVGALFHFAVWQLFDIQIASNTVAYGAFVSWACISPRFTDWARASFEQLGKPVKALLCAVPFVFSAWSLLTYTPDFKVAILIGVSKVVLVIALGMGASYLALRLLQLSSRAPAREG